MNKCILKRLGIEDFISKSQANWKLNLAWFFNPRGNSPPVRVGMRAGCRAAARAKPESNETAGVSPRRFILKFRKLMLRVVYLVLFLSFVVNTCCYGLAPELRTATPEFKEFYTAASICRTIEQGNLDSNSCIDNIFPKLEALKRSYRNVSITILPHEVIVDIPGEGMAVRYFDPRNANVVTPFSNISKLRTKIINGKLLRQIIYRTKALGNDAEKQIHKERLSQALERKYKAIALDIDGTIKKSSLPIDESILRKLIEYVRNGGILILATRRDRDSVDRVFFGRLKEIGTDLLEDLYRRIFICGDNGSSVFNYLEFTQKSKKIVDSELGLEPDALRDKVCNNPLKPFLDEGLLASEDILITQNKVQIKLAGKKYENSDKIAQSLNKYFSEQKMSLRVIKSKHRIDANNANSSKMSGVEAIAEFLGIKTTEIAKIGDELNVGGNDSSFDDRASFSVREYNSKSQYQISVKLAKGIEGPEATSWLIDNLNFDFVEAGALGILIDQREPSIEAISKRLLDYFKKPFNERTEADRESLLSSLGIKNPAAFMEEEATRHRKKNDRAKTEEDKRLVYEIVKASGIDYLLDPHNPDLRIAYRYKKGASRPNSKYAIPNPPKHVLATLFKIKFKYSGLEKAIITFLGLNVSDFLSTGGEIVSFNIQDYGTNCVIKLNLRHPLVSNNKPTTLFIKIDSWQCINDFGSRYENSGMRGYINEERFSISHAPFTNYVSQKYGLHMPQAYSDNLFLISESGGQDYIAVIDGINTGIGSGDANLAQEFLFNAGMNNAFVDLFALYDRVVTLKKLGDKEPPLGGQFVVCYKDGKPVLSLVDYDWLFQLDEFWRRLSEFQGKDPCRLLSDLVMFTGGKNLLTADVSETNLTAWSRAVTMYVKGYMKLWSGVEANKNVLFKKMEELYYERIKDNCKRVLETVREEDKAEIIASWFNELPGTTKNMARFLDASSNYRGYFDKQRFESEEQKAAILKDIQSRVNKNKEEQGRFVALCRNLPSSDIAEKYAQLYIERIKGQMQTVLDAGCKELVTEVFKNYFSGLKKAHPKQEDKLAEYERKALTTINELFTPPANITSRFPIVLVMGYPGAGKSSISSLMAERLGVPHISKGDVLRDMHKKYPDIKDIPSQAVEMISRYIEENQIDLSRGVIIDWNARYAGPIELSQEFFDKHNLYLSTVIYVDVDAQTAQERLVGRQRATDLKRIDARIKQHEEVDIPLVEKYYKQGLVIRVPNGSGIALDDAVSDATKKLREKKSFFRNAENGVEHNISPLSFRIEEIKTYISTNENMLITVLRERHNIVLRIPIEAIGSIGINNIKDFLAIFQEVPNGYVELYYTSGIGEVSESMYQKYGLQKKPLPKDFKRTRENTVTLFPALKGEEINQATIVSRFGSLDLTPQDTILSPIGLQHDSAGLIRATILGLKMMDIARQIKEKGIGITKDQAFKDKIQLEILEQLKNVCDTDDLKNFNLTPDDIIALATGTINDIINALKKLIKLLPITPIDAERLRQIYEHAKQALIAA